MIKQSSKKPPSKTSASNSLRDSKSNRSNKSIIDDDDDKMSVRSGSTVRTNKSNIPKDIKEKEMVSLKSIPTSPDINLNKNTLVLNEGNSYAQLQGRLSLKGTLPAKAAQKDNRIIELEDTCQIIMNTLRDNEIKLNNISAEQQLIQNKNQSLEADIQFLEDSMINDKLNQWIQDSKINQFVYLNYELTTLQSQNEKLIDLGNDKQGKLKNEYDLMQEELIKRSKVNNYLRKINKIMFNKLERKRKRIKEKKDKKSCNIEDHFNLNTNIEKLRELQEHQIQIEKEQEDFKKSSMIRYEEMENERKLREEFFRQEVQNLQEKLKQYEDSELELKELKLENENQASNYKDSETKINLNSSLKSNKENMMNTKNSMKSTSNKPNDLLDKLIKVDEFKWIYNCKADSEVLQHKCVEQIANQINKIDNLEQSLRDKINQCLGLENKLADRENCISLQENRIKALEDKFKIQSTDESQSRSQKLHLEAEIIKMASKMKDMEFINQMQADLKHKHFDRTEENRMMAKEIELLRMKNKSLNEQLMQITNSQQD